MQAILPLALCEGLTFVAGQEGPRSLLSNNGEKRTQGKHRPYL